MSRLAQSNRAAPVAKRDARTAGVGGAQDGELLHNNLERMNIDQQGDSTDNRPKSEACPVCNSTKYLNSNLRFLVNPECYHKVCESCVDRIFSNGPATCPIQGCSRTLRKHRFREQTFEDIKVEREVDIRKRVQAVFNRREDDFEGLRDYNDYLNDVEDITFNLINNIDLEDTNRRFEAYQKANQTIIAENERLAREEKMGFAANQKAERLLARERRDAARREEEDERREIEEGRRDVLKRLAAGGDAEKVTKEGQQVQLKKRLNKQAAAQRQQELQNAAGTGNGTAASTMLKGLKARPKKAEPEAPIDPFGGLRFTHKYFEMQDDYRWEGIQDTMKDVRHMAGGYDVRDFTQRSLVAAFSGLGVFAGEEGGEMEKVMVDEKALGTARADLGLKDSGMAEAPR
ncbi:hypothetical protein B0A50_04337 [Salinomyces thailandicus]|uniref:RNA polymerase II transcription factor B subunit 3 n=1 Tax=Salinomyces thailandicus TaxID=706561 RepID=A0A4U0TWU0_9PEZI|nr:hypothetical protein B0A50_04337 [Salinomyces thailandica]